MKLRGSSLETLRVFEACARHGNYTRAADELGVSAAAVSHRMRVLQAEIGATLFHRSGPRVTLSDAGRRLAERVGAAMGELATAIAECKDGNVVRVSAAPTFAARWLAPRLASFNEQFGIAVALDSADDIRPPGSFDVAVRSGLGKWAGYRARPLFPVERTPLFNPHRYHPVEITTPADLLACRLIDSEDWERWFAVAGVDRNPGGVRTSAAHYPTQDLAGAAVLEGAGVGLLSPRLFQSAIARGELVQPFEIVLSGPEAYWLLVGDRETTTAARTFCDWVLATCDAQSGSAPMIKRSSASLAAAGDRRGAR